MKSICLIFWMLISLILVCSIFGLLLFVSTDYNENYDNVPSTWCTIGRKLLDAVVSNN